MTYPDIHMVFATDWGLDMLKKKGETCFIDGTFELVEMNLFLTTIMVKEEGRGIPVAFLLSNKRTTQAYSDFLERLRTLTDNSWSPLFCYCDFEAAIHSAFHSQYSKCTVYGDAFHFFYSNRQWLRQNGLNEHEKDVDSALHVLWSAPTQPAFLLERSRFEREWKSKLSTYWE